MRTCLHGNTANHFDNPRRFFCLNCRTQFIDYGNGYEPALDAARERPSALDVELPANMALNPYIHGHVDVLTTAPGRPHALDVEALAGAMHDEYEGIGHPDAACWPWPGCPAAISWRERATAILARLTEPDAGEGTDRHCICQVGGYTDICPIHPDPDAGEGTERPFTMTYHELLQALDDVQPDADNGVLVLQVVAAVRSNR